MEQGSDNIVVIGAGIGGLATAIRLAAAGRDVSVLEAQDYPGGKIRTLPSVAGPVDAGPTVLTMRSVFDAIFEAGGTSLDEHVTLIREPCLARHWWPDGTCLDLYDDPDRSAAEISAVFGSKSAEDYRGFATQTRELFDAFDKPLMRAAEPSPLRLTRSLMARPDLLLAMGPFRTMARQLARDFSEPKLRQLFGRYATYVGGSPYASPAVLRLVAHAEAAGVWLVKGGMAQLATAMADLAKRLGAELHFGAQAERIEIQSGKIVAVHAASGARFPASRVVFNGDPRALAVGALGPLAQGAVTARNTEPRSLSANVWAFAATPRGVDLAHHNVFFGEDARNEFDPIAGGVLPIDPTLYVCAQDRLPGTTPPEVERFEIIMNAPPVQEGSQEDLATCRTRTFPVLAGRGLRFSPEPPDTALTTPKGFNALFPESQGSLYGRSPHGQMAAFARPGARTSLPGLYLAGGGAHPGAGVPMAALSGQHAAEAILMDQTSTSPSPQMAMPGGMSTGSRIAAPVPSPSSPS